MARANAGKLELTIDLKGVDKTGATVNKAQKGMEKLGEGAGKASQKTKDLSNSTKRLSDNLISMLPHGNALTSAINTLGGSTGGLSAGMMKAAGAAAAFGTALFAMRGQSMEAAALEFRLSRLSGGYFEASQHIAKLKRESHGVFSTKDLVDFMVTQKEMGVDLGITGAQLEKLDLRFTALNMTVGDGLKMIVRAVKTGRQMYLQKLGLVEDLTSSWREEAKAVGHVLTMQEKMNVVMRELKIGIAGIKMGGIGGEITAFERMDASIADMEQSFGDMLGPLFQALAPWVEAFERLVAILAPVVSLLMRVVQAVIGPLGEIIRGILDVVARYFVPLVTFIDQKVGEFLTDTMQGWRLSFDELGGLGEALLKKTIAVWTSTKRILQAMGVLSKDRWKDLKAHIQTAELAAQQEEAMEQQAKHLKEMKKLREDGAKLEAKMQASIFSAEVNLLKMLSTSRKLTAGEKKRLGFFQKAMRIEAATAKIMALRTELLVRQNILIDEQNKLSMGGNFLAPGAIQKWKELADQIQTITNRIEFLGNQSDKLAAAAGAAPPKGEKKGKGKAADPEKAAKAAAAAKLKGIQDELKIDRLDLEIGKVGELNEVRLAELDLELKLLGVSDLRAQGKVLQAYLTERLIKKQHALTLEKIKTAEANKALAGSEWDLSGAMSSISAAGAGAEGQTKALALSTGAALAVTKSMVNKEKSWHTTLLASAGPLRAAGQAWAEEESNKAKIAGAMELAFAAAAFATPDPMAGLAHLAAAAMFFKVSTQAGTAAPAAARTPTARMPAEKAAGPRQVVINFNGIQTDPQTTARQISDVLASQRGTGA